MLFDDKVYAKVFVWGFDNEVKIYEIAYIEVSGIDVVFSKR